MRWKSFSKVEEGILQWQVQRPLRNLAGLASYCGQGCPRVAVNHPLPRDDEDAYFFPTVFWLTCPEAVRQIHRIEDQGFIQRIQDQIQLHQGLYLQVKEAHQEYIFIRRALAHANPAPAGMSRSLEKLGIGGLPDLGRVKCLHMHYAHYLATGNNPIGRLVGRMLEYSSQTWQCRVCSEASKNAGVAEQADAADLKSAGPKGSCRFEPGPRHQIF